MSINDYIKQKKKGVKTPNENVNKAPREENKFSSPEEAFNAYSKLGQEDLMLELFKVANDSRERGELSDEGLDNFYRNVQGMLTPEQSAKMRQLIQDLKR